MSERQWTTEQRQCIDARGGTLLVSAAAGSGKTAVLVERILTRLTDPQQPVDVDRLLVVTFTKAAAAEMKQRLSAALSARIAAQPDDIRLQRQQAMLSHAHISTVHSFCAQLLREHFQQLDISPQFRVPEDAETALLREDALSAALEEGYAAGDEAFLELAGLLSSGRDDRGLAAAVSRLFDFIQAHPFPEQWLAAQQAAYADDRPLPQTAWGGAVLRRIAATLAYAVSLLDKAMELAEEEALMAAAYTATLRGDRDQLQSALRRLSGCAWDGLADILNAACGGFGRLGVLRQYPEPERKERVAALREEAKKRVRELPDLLCGSEAECRDDMAACGRLAAALFRLVERYGELYAAKKRQRRILDFNDLEHGALRLLARPGDDGTLWRTPLAEELSQDFDEVLVDEYQDTNAAQDALFRCLSREEANLFLVGDVKQSIYGFRQAMPAIFIDRRDRYPAYDGSRYPASIALHNNFRSRRQVTDAVNFVFRHLMMRETGGIDYDEREALVASAAYPEAPGYETELTLLDSSDLAPGDNRDAAEARLIAARIRELVGTLPVTEDGRQRPARYGDICIVLRSKAGHAAAYADELGRCGIPAVTAAAGGFFGAPEVAMALALLRVIDNPLQDIPLLAVMLSPVFGFTPDDMASIRLAEQDCPLYAAVRRAAHGRPADLSRRCAAFLKQMDGFRLLAATMPADRLIHRLYEETGMPATAGAQRHGPQRMANLRLLQEYARRFEQGGFRGLSSFVRYLDRLEQQNLDMAPAAALDGSGDAVRILSIHNSKGLEFPIVFLAGLGGLFNPESTRGTLLLHPEAGAGLMRFDPETGIQWNTLPRQGVALSIQDSERAEELRVLYVAMTRAREKLCMVMSLRDPAARLTKLAAPLGEGDTLPPFTVLTARGMGDWLLAAGLHHPSGGELRRLAGDEGIPLHTAEQPWHVTLQRPLPPDAATDAAPLAAAQPDQVLLRELRERLAWRYPYAALAAVPTKLAASAIGGEGVERAFVAAARPSFLGAAGLTPAERGTALHTFMQFARYDRAAADPATEITRLVGQGFLTRQQGAALPLPKIRRFFSGDLYRRMQAAPVLLREQRFTVELPATVFRDDLPDGAADETVVVQGIADCVFEEGGGLVIVDYKTDHIKAEEELVRRYAPQLAVYAYALTRTLERPVAECLLYSFALGRTVRLPVTHPLFGAAER